MNDQIVDEARAYVEAHCEHGDQFTRGPALYQAELYITGLLAALDARDAWIAGMKAEFQDEECLTELRAALDRVRADYRDTVTCLNNERKRALELIKERDAEIARLREVFDRICEQHSEAMRRTCNAHDAEIARLSVENEWNGAAANDMQARAIAAQEESARLRTEITAPPGAEVMKRAALALNCAYHRVSFDTDQTDRDVHIEEVARALQQYGDKRAREASALVCEASNATILVARQVAREAAIEEAARAAKGNDVERITTHDAAAAYLVGRIDAASDVRALAAKPGAQSLW